MCPRCHQGSSDEEIVRQLQEKPKYELWNEISLSHLAICISGYNGRVASDLAIQLIDGYINYKTTNTKECDGTLFGNPTVAQATFYKKVGLEVRDTSEGLDKHNILTKYQEVYEKYVNSSHTCILS